MSRPSSRVSRIVPAALLLFAGVALALGVYTLSPRWGGLAGSLDAIQDTTVFDQEPVYAGVLDLGGEDSLLKPGALFFGDGLYYIAYEGSDRVDVLDRRFERVKTLHLSHGRPAGITGIAAGEGQIYVADSRSGEVRFHNSDGTVRNAFSWLPGKAGRLRPHGLSLFEGNLYVTDLEHRQMLVISVSTVPGITEEGEVLFAVPGPGRDSALFLEPVNTAVTPDGRILVSDAGTRYVKAFTCNGRFAYEIAPDGGTTFQSPRGIAFDDVQNPSLVREDARSFDPSGIRSQGRMHVVDGGTGDVVVFDATGRYVLRYGKAHLRRPDGIAIDRESRTVVIADAGIRGLVAFKY